MAAPQTGLGASCQIGDIGHPGIACGNHRHIPNTEMLGKAKQHNKHNRKAPQLPQNCNSFQQKIGCIQTHNACFLVNTLNYQQSY